VFAIIKPDKKYILFYVKYLKKTMPLFYATFGQK